MEKNMKGRICSVSEEFFKKFPDCNLMQNKEGNGGKIALRPCFLAIEDKNIKWLVPISSKVEKYKKIVESKILKYGKCDNIYIGKFQNKERPQ